MINDKLVRLSVLVAMAIVVVGVALWKRTEPDANAPRAAVYKLASCGCCNAWVDHLRGAGFVITSHNVQNMNEIRASHGVPASLGSCHTAIVEGYVIEGHIPADDVKRLLREKPDIVGLSAPGMPPNSPGMQPAWFPSEGFNVLAFDDKGTVTVFTEYPTAASEGSGR